MDNGLGPDLLQTLGIALFEHGNDGLLRLAGRTPKWFDQIYGHIDSSAGEINVEDISPFVVNFMTDAERHWALGTDERLCSGLWIETDPSGNEYGFEASALSLGGKRILLIELGQYSFKEKQHIITEGRSMGLDHERLRRQERELRLFNIELEGRLVQSQKMEAVGTLTSGIAHDFNNILHAISGYLHLLRTKENLDGTAGRYISQIEGVVEQATELVRRLLTFGRKMERKFVALDLNHEVVQVVQILERTIPKMVGINLRLADDLKMVQGDRTQLEQVIMNLGSNAKDAMPGGGTLTIATENVALDRSYCSFHPEASPGGYVRLRVSDTGHGMNPDTIEHIFEPFFTTKEVGKGTGLGLSTVYGIVTGHGGHITCDSQPDQGTVFDIYLPAIETPASGLSPAQEYETRSFRGDETILLVDDDFSAREVGQAILEQYDYTTYVAHNGEQALEIYGADPGDIDLVVLDLIMPGMGGYECLNKLIELDPEVKVIVASGFLAEEQEERIIEAGARGFIGKPYRILDFLERLRKVLDE